jgi:restriction system protein
MNDGRDHAERQGELVAGVFQLLTQQHMDGRPAKEVLARLRAQVPPTPFEANDYPNHPGVNRYEHIVRFSTIPFVKAGWLTKTRGQWSVTDEGSAALARHANDPEAFMREAVAHYRQWKKGQPETADEIETEEVVVAGRYEEAEEAAFSETIDYVDAMAPYDFQDLVAALLEAMGYHVLWVAPPGPDKGVDGSSSPLAGSRATYGPRRGPMRHAN